MNDELNDSLPPELEGLEQDITALENTSLHDLYLSLNASDVGLFEDIQQADPSFLGSIPQTQLEEYFSGDRSFRELLLHHPTLQGITSGGRARLLLGSKLPAYLEAARLLLDPLIEADKLDPDVQRALSEATASMTRDYQAGHDHDSPDWS